ncbi:hypothetical protein [Scrofimicrobium sp. R131]|uniref:5-formyltetrahydrofolate cyclo-ligase n=1 Tax=Scrofimicrobium appendicitidis TaxID=3079930 RepID=A0AAU7V7B2_9ACTO
MTGQTTMEDAAQLRRENQRAKHRQRLLRTLMRPRLDESKLVLAAAAPTVLEFRTGLEFGAEPGTPAR